MLVQNETYCKEMTSMTRLKMETEFEACSFGLERVWRTIYYLVDG
jgi:hypothetical protein